ncbi:unnamed protein product [Cuscuta europaea]|uniref:Uncharacterized protein n=2 Tax=Cuscuta europaea TaxID=41803 RepID=A0A9P1ECD0_CUSEU|nr:unnamed protein product [Cuscuta europaea]
MGTTGGVENDYQPMIEVPFDLFVTKKQNVFDVDGRFQFTDLFGNLLFEVEGLSADSSSHPNGRKFLIDAAGDTLITVVQAIKGKWEGFKGESTQEREMMFKVERVTNTFTDKEFEIFLCDENIEEGRTDFRMKGCPFKRSCTIYKGNSILAQTSLMYTIGTGKYCVPRSRFRITLFPGPCDLVMIVSLVVIFFYKRRFLV